MEKAASQDARGLREWGQARWTLLKRRLTSLRRAPTLADLDGVPGHPHALSADRQGQFSLDLDGPYRLVFAPDHDPLPALPDGGLDRAAVTAVQILEITNYHGH